MSFRCSACGRAESKWTGRCGGCGEWGTVVAEREEAVSARTIAPARLVRYAEAERVEAARRRTGLDEFDRVLGGGFLPGAVVLLSGDPGIGKSTLALAASRNFTRVLYASGEESMPQVRHRISRLGLDAERILGTDDERIEAILSAARGGGAARSERPDLVVLDSVQTLRSEEAPGAPGSVSQVRAVTEATCAFAKSTHTPVLLVGHVTKEGEVAGPMHLSHLVDVVLLLETDESGGLRILRASKNRFGSTEEAGFFRLVERGIEEVPDPEAALSTARSPGAAAIAGRVRFPAVFGSRVLLVEIEALVLPTRAVPPRRLVTGLDPGRVAMLLAVLERRLGLRFQESEVFLKTVGGHRIQDPAADLPAALALASALSDRPLPEDLAAFGEVGLGGDLRPSRWAESRARAATRLGARVLCAGGVRTLAEALAASALAPSERA